MEILLSDDEDTYGDLESGRATQLLPTQSRAASEVSSKPVAKSRLADVWDEGEELFDIGDDSGDEHEDDRTPRPPPAPAPIPHLPSPATH